MGLASLHADVLLDNELKLFNNIVNLYSKLFYEVLLKSGKLYCESIEVDSAFWT